MRAACVVAVSLVIAGAVAAASPAPASASLCGAVGWINGPAAKACGLVTNGDKLLNAGKKAVTGHIGGAVKTVLGGGGGGGGGSKAAALVSLAAIGAWVTGGARVALSDTAKVLGHTTDPRLGSTWFSATYWRMAGIAALLTLPFLFAAAAQALIRSDLALLARAALGYLPLSLLAVGIAAPLTTLLLAACDEMSSIVSAAAGHAGTHLLGRLVTLTGGLVALARSPFLAFLVGLLTAAGAIALWIELLIREAAVYVVVLMLPLAFAALVWPARRVWAIRAVEMLVALILSKFAIVAVLALGGAALDHAGGPTGMLTGLVLVILGAFAPWALVRLLPLAELASGAADQLRGGLSRAHRTLTGSDEALSRAENWAGALTAGMRRQADATFEGFSGSGSHADGARGELEKLTAPSGQAPEDPTAEPDPVAASEPVPVAAGAGGGAEGDGLPGSSAGDPGPAAGASPAGAGTEPPGGTEAGYGPATGPAPADETAREAPADDGVHDDGQPSGSWDGSVAAEEGRWRVPPMGPKMLAGRPFWEPADEGTGEHGGPENRRSGGAPTADDHDLLPPEQDRGDGRL